MSMTKKPGRRLLPVLALACLGAVTSLHGASAQTAKPMAYKPVTDARLLNPEAENWLMFRRTYDGWGYSPLEQINRGNVEEAAAGLDVLDRLARRPPGAADRQQRRHVRHHAAATRCSRSNAKTGDLLWRYKRELPDDIAQPHPTNRGVGAVRATRSTSRRWTRYVVALDAKTGKEVWDTAVDDRSNGYYIHARAARRQRQGDGRRLGRRIRRPRLSSRRSTRRPARKRGARYTIPAPGEPGSETWEERRQLEDRRRLGLGHRQLTIRSSTSPTGAPATPARGWATCVPATTSTPPR